MVFYDFTWDSIKWRIRFARQLGEPVRYWAVLYNQANISLDGSPRQTLLCKLIHDNIITTLSKVHKTENIISIIICYPCLGLFQCNVLLNLCKISSQQQSSKGLICLSASRDYYRTPSCISAHYLPKFVGLRIKLLPQRLQVFHEKSGVVSITETAFVC